MGEVGVDPIEPGLVGSQRSGGVCGRARHAPGAGLFLDGEVRGFQRALHHQIDDAAGLEASEEHCRRSLENLDRLKIRCLEVGDLPNPQIVAKAAGVVEAADIERIIEGPAAVGGDAKGLHAADIADDRVPDADVLPVVHRLTRDDLHIRRHFVQGNAVLGGDGGSFGIDVVAGEAAAEPGAALAAARLLSTRKSGAGSGDRLALWRRLCRLV